MIKVFSIFLFLLLFSCGTKSKDDAMDVAQNEIKLYEQLDNQVEQLLLSDAAYDVDIIPLETTDESVFKNIYNLIVDEEMILLNAMTDVLQFDLSGKFRQSISRRGEGPTEYNYCSGIGLDKQTKQIYLASGFSINNEIKAYTWENTHVKTVRVGQPGDWMNSNSVKGEDRTYAFYENKHMVRRALPSQDGKPGLWQICILNKEGEKIKQLADPNLIAFQQEFMQKAYDMSRLDARWASYSPVLNRYKDQWNCLFSSNDTLYTLHQENFTLEPRWVISCGERPSEEDIYRLGKEMSFFKYLFVTDVMETKDYLYLVSEKDSYAYLSKVDKQTGVIESIRQKGEIKKYEMLNEAYSRRCESPRFTNDLCGGLPFFPYYQNESCWIMAYQAFDLINEIDLDELKKSEVLLPEKRDELVRVIENLEEDDNPVLILMKLKK